MEADRVAWRQWLYLIIQNRGSDNAESKLVRTFANHLGLQYTDEAL
jgi:hypothetical protein